MAKIYKKLNNYENIRPRKYNIKLLITAFLIAAGIYYSSAALLAETKQEQQANTPQVESTEPVYVPKKLDTVDLHESKEVEKVKSNPEEIDWDPYMKELTSRIKRNWNPPKGNESKRVVVLFKVNREGRLLNVKVIKSSRKKEIDEAAIKAVKLTAPFRSFPVASRDKTVDIEFTFEYKVFDIRDFAK